jgi:2-polyprenyl-3-methyl-5-hydroxy-6-metoxy-1,4-benzoquinol methylase
MPAPGDYHEALWEGVPEGLDPPAEDLRRAFLLEHVRAAAGITRADGHTARTAGSGTGRERLVRVLDVGCGEGRFAAELARAGAEVVGIDVAAEPLRRARARHPELDLRQVQAEAAWPLQDASFDVVWAGEVIEHVADTSGWLSEVRRVLRPGAVLLLSTPDHGRLQMLWWALARSAFESHFDPRADHLRFYTRRTLIELLEDFGFSGVEVRSAGGPPGARRRLLARAVRSRW